MIHSLEMFCPPNITINQFWIHHGFNPCLMNTIISTVNLLFMLIFGSIQFWFYRKYASIVNFYQLPYSQLFGLQMVLNGVMPFIAVIRIILESMVLHPGIVYGYMLFSTISSIICWSFVSFLILKERNYMLPTIPRRSHGIVLLLFWTWTFCTENLYFLNIYGTDWFFTLKTSTEIIQFSLFVFEYGVTAGIFILGLQAPGIPSFRHSDSFARLHPGGDEEQTTTNSTNGSPCSKIIKKIRMLAPFIWPSKSIRLQVYVVLCFVAMVLGRVINVYVPMYSKKIVDSITIPSNSTSGFGSQFLTVGFAAYHLTFRWDLILIYVILKVIQGGGQGSSGILNITRSMLWISVQQFTTREVEVHFFEHLHKLSLRYHLQRKTGEVLRAMDRGTESINNILDYLVFSILPTIADIIIAIVYFTTYFNLWFGLIVFTTMVLYLIATFTITEWRTKFRRFMNQADNEQKQRAIDSLLNFETVKYYTNENYETRRYADAVKRYQKEEWKVTASICVLNLTQLVIINAGLLAGSTLCISMIVYEKGLTVGDYVLFSTYLLQLYAPLNFFGTYYRMLQRCFIDMENMLDLLKEEQEIIDDPNAKDLIVQNGTIEFRNVNFSYIPGKQVLKNISFVVPGGKSVALVGASGGGKTSITRLLFRFYDVSSGEILIDGQNIQKVTQMSLRRSIGVVPQDTVLFNDTVRQNILYGRIEAEESEVEEAAKAACIHERVETFAEGYDTVVGERGLKLSGGEKQRVAIARTILKNPAVILLDEATSALDTHTERQIQSSLQTLCENRTSIIVAHRLSTIVNVNLILVLKDGEIAERGTHNELLSSNGLYASLWNEQLRHSTDIEDVNDNENGGAGGGDDSQINEAKPDKVVPQVNVHPEPNSQSHHIRT